MPDPIPLRGTSLHDGVAARLRAMVFDGDLPPDAFIDEKAEHRNFNALSQSQQRLQTRPGASAGTG